MDFLLPLIRPWTTILTQPIMGIFTLMSLVQVWRGLGSVKTLKTRWSEFTQAPLEGWKRQLAESASFYVAVPIGVLIHELGHAVVVKILGGKVVEFGFFFFWGYVLPDRSFSPVAEWVLSSAGTWGSLLFALVVWIGWANNDSLGIRLLARRTTRFQIFFALIYYPLFTAVLSFGDWRTIYDFKATPMLSSVTAVVHVLILLGYKWMDSHHYFEVLDEGSAELLSQPLPSGDLRSQLVHLEKQAAAGLRPEAKKNMASLLKQHPDSAEAHLTHAFLQISGQKVPRQTATSAEKALALGLSGSDQSRAHLVIGAYADQMERTEAAFSAYGLGLRAAAQSSNIQRQLLMRRGLLFRRLGRDQEAKQDISQAITSARVANNKEALKYYQDTYQQLFGTPPTA